MKTQAEIITEVVRVFDENIAELSACDNDDYILYIPDTQLAISFNEEGKPFATSPARAERIGTEQMPEEAWAYVPSISDGAGRKAEIWKRKKACAHDLAIIVQTRKNILERGVA